MTLDFEKANHMFNLVMNPTNIQSKPFDKPLEHVCAIAFCKKSTHFSYDYCSCVLGVCTSTVEKTKLEGQNR